MSDSLSPPASTSPPPPTPTPTARRSTRPLSIRQHLAASAAAAGKRKPRVKKAAKKMTTMTMTMMTPPSLLSNVNQHLINILKLTKAHYVSDNVKKSLKKSLHTIENSGDCPYGKHSSAVSHHFTARGDINMQSELRGINI